MTVSEFPVEVPADHSETSSTVQADGTRTRPVWPFVLGGLIALAVVVAGLWYSTRPEPVPLQGTVEATEVNVATKAFARVERLNADEGDTVRAGEKLADLSSPGIDAAIAQAESSLDTARALDAIVNNGARPEDVASLRSIAASSRAAANLASVTARRMNRLYAEGVVSAQRRDEANAAATASAANAAAAQSQYQKAIAGRRPESKEIASAQTQAAQDRLDAARQIGAEKMLVSPIAGEIARRNAEQGEVLAPGVPAFQIVDIEHPFVTVRVAEDRLNGLRKGQVLVGKIPALGDRQIQFRVRTISAQASYASERATRQSAGFDARSFEVRLDPVRNGAGLRSGMSVLFDWPQ